MPLLKAKPNPTDTLAELIDQQAQTMAAIAKEERESARLERLLRPGIQLASDPWPPTLTRGQIAATERALRESSDRLGELETALRATRQELAAARATETARIIAVHRPRQQTMVKDALEVAYTLQRMYRELVADEDAEAAELGRRRPSEDGRSLALPGGWGHPEGEERLATYARANQAVLEG